MFQNSATLLTHPNILYVGYQLTGMVQFDNTVFTCIRHPSLLLFYISMMNLLGMIKSINTESLNLNKDLFITEQVILKSNDQHKLVLI